MGTVPRGSHHQGPILVTPKPGGVPIDLGRKLLGKSLLDQGTKLCAIGPAQEEQQPRPPIMIPGLGGVKAQRV